MNQKMNEILSTIHLWYVVNEDTKEVLATSSHPTLLKSYCYFLSDGDEESIVFGGYDMASRIVGKDNLTQTSTKILHYKSVSYLLTKVVESSERDKKHDAVSLLSATLVKATKMSVEIDRIDLNNGTIQFFDDSILMVKETVDHKGYIQTQRRPA